MFWVFLHVHFCICFYIVSTCNQWLKFYCVPFVSIFAWLLYYLIIYCTVAAECPYVLYLLLHSAWFSISPFWAFSSAYLSYFWKVLSFLPHPMMHFPDNQGAHSIPLTFFNTKFTEKLTMNCRISLLYGLASAKSNVMGMIHVRFKPGNNTA